MSTELALLLSHPLRQRLLFEYDRTSSPSKVARRLDRRVNVISYHTNVLLDHGWIELVRTEPRRGATEHYYRSIGPPDIEDDAWERLPAQLRRAIVLGMIGMTGEQAHDAALQGGFDGARAHLSRSPLDLDERGAADVAALLREVVGRFQEIAAASRARTPDPRERHEVVIQYFHVPATA